MTVDLEGFTSAQIVALINQAQAELAARQQEDADTERGLREGLSEAVATLDALIGSPDSGPNVTSIHGVRQYDDAAIEQHTVLAIRLILDGLLVTAETLRDVARITGR